MCNRVLWQSDTCTILGPWLGCRVLQHWFSTNALQYHLKWWVSDLLNDSTILHHQSQKDCGLNVKWKAKERIKSWEHGPLQLMTQKLPFQQCQTSSLNGMHSGLLPLPSALYDLNLHPFDLQEKGKHGRECQYIIWWGCCHVKQLPECAGKIFSSVNCMRVQWNL